MADLRSLALIGFAAVPLGACQKSDGDMVAAPSGGMNGEGGVAQAGSSGAGSTNEPDPQGGAAQAGSSAGGSTNEPDPMSAGGAPPQDSECGLSNAAFCETFEAGPAATRGRGGDVDPTLFSMGRVAPQNMSGGDKVEFVGYATLPTCREGVSGKVVPPDDSLICTPTAAVGSSHLLMAVASQNYGLNSLRVRQPFDFADRTGTIGFDVDATMTNGLWGWASVEITEDPEPTPLFTDYEYGPLPRNALELQFDHDGCANPEPHVSLKNVLVFEDHVLTKLTNLAGDQPTCFATKSGHLNRVRVRVSQTKVEVLAGDFSPDGLSFPEPRLVFSANMDLPFSRGYVHFSGHNHATLKYGGDDSWVVRWDNVGFDGPRIMGFREYEIPDARTPANVDGYDGVNLGYQVDETGMTTCCPTASVPSLTFENVDVTGASKATLTFTSYYLNWEQADITKYTLRYRFNGREFISRVLTAGEVFALKVKGQVGSLVQSIDVPLAELQNGTNTLEFVTSNVDLTYKPVLANIDLVLQTK
jgi:hypothetical protein